MRSRRLIPLLLASCTAVVLAAAPEKNPMHAAHAARVDAMKRLDAWVGEWKGSGWSVGPDGAKVEFEQIESVTRRAGGSVHLVLGTSRSKASAAGGEIVHDGVVLVSFDDAQGRYRWHGHDVPWGATDATVTLVEDGFEWRMAGPGGVTVRFTIRLDAMSWREVGETSADGEHWATFMRTDLERVE